MIQHHAEILIWAPEVIETYQCGTACRLNKSVSEELNLGTLVSDYFIFPFQAWVISKLGFFSTLIVNILRFFSSIWLISYVELNSCLNEATVVFPMIW